MEQVVKKYLHERLLDEASQFSFEFERRWDNGEKQRLLKAFSEEDNSGVDISPLHKVRMLQIGTCFGQSLAIWERLLHGEIREMNQKILTEKLVKERIHNPDGLSSVQLDRMLTMLHSRNPGDPASNRLAKSLEHYPLSYSITGMDLFPERYNLYFKDRLQHMLPFDETKIAGNFKVDSTNMTQVLDFHYRALTAKGADNAKSGAMNDDAKAVNSDSTEEEVPDISPEYDIIIDDGDHSTDGMERTFENMFFRFLKPGGVYIMEDINMMFHPVTKDDVESLEKRWLDSRQWILGDEISTSSQDEAWRPSDGRDLTLSPDSISQADEYKKSLVPKFGHLRSNLGDSVAPAVLTDVKNYDDAEFLHWLTKTDAGQQTQRKMSHFLGLPLLVNSISTQMSISRSSYESVKHQNLDDSKEFGANTFFKEMQGKTMAEFDFVQVRTHMEGSYVRRVVNDPKKHAQYIDVDKSKIDWMHDPDGRKFLLM